MDDKIEVKVYGTSRVPVTINPSHVIESLLNEVKHGHYGWIQETNGRYYIMESEHNIDNEVKEVSKRVYEYYEALKLVDNYLKNI